MALAAIFFDLVIPIMVTGNLSLSVDECWLRLISMQVSKSNSPRMQATEFSIVRTKVLPEEMSHYWVLLTLKFDLFSSESLVRD